MRYPKYIEDDLNFPDFYPVTMRYPELALEDPVQSLRNTLGKIVPGAGIRRGDSVAIGVGSRGIANLSSFVSQICRCMADIGAKPFIIPSMGSHGGATSDGQIKVLEKLGVTEKICGAPVISSMDVIEVGETIDGVPIFFSKDAFEMDHTICINRIKPHTKFKGPVESGIYKMLCIGMGKHRGALIWHQMALKHGFTHLLKSMGDQLIARTNVRFGIAVVEDFYDKTLHVEAIAAQDLYMRESELMDMARAYFPHLPFKELDVLIIEQIGKEISGAGMDPNVTGRTFDLMEDDFSSTIEVGRVVILNLSEKTSGNGIGLGNADIITEKVFQALDYESTLMNALTSISLRKAFIPVRLPNDKKAIQAAFTTLGPLNPDDVRAVIIKDTLHTANFFASEALLPVLQKIDNVQIGKSQPLLFNSNVDLTI